MGVYGVNELKMWVFIHIHANRAWEWTTTGHPHAIVSACASRIENNMIKITNQKEAWAKWNKDNK